MFSAVCQELNAMIEDYSTVQIKHGLPRLFINTDAFGDTLGPRTLAALSRIVVDFTMSSAGGLQAVQYLLDHMRALSALSLGCPRMNGQEKLTDAPLFTVHEGCRSSLGED